MSKAFTRESDEIPERPSPRLQGVLPTGVKNYLTPEGARAFQDELHQLVEVERPRLSANLTDKHQSEQKLQSLDQRTLQLRHILESAVIVPPPPSPWNQARFGATVAVRDSRGERSSYRIVGVPEVDAEKGWVSWLSPIAKALINAKLGQQVRFRVPSGEEQLEVLEISYGESRRDQTSGQY